MAVNPYASPATSRAEQDTPPSAEDGGMSTWAWWQSRRLGYNVGLVCAGGFAFLCYVTVCFTLLPRVLNPGEIDVTPLTTVVQLVGYLLMMGVANVCYCLGPLCEPLVSLAWVPQYRKIAYGLGLWFSILLPFGVPAMLTVNVLFFPSFFDAERRSRPQVLERLRREADLQYKRPKRTLRYDGHNR
jgi:hypothetical protein